jgi:hypothetical protein
VKDGPSPGPPVVVIVHIVVEAVVGVHTVVDIVVGGAHVVSVVVIVRIVVEAVVGVHRVVDIVVGGAHVVSVVVIVHIVVEAVVGGPSVVSVGGVSDSKQIFQPDFVTEKSLDHVITRSSTVPSAGGVVPLNGRPLIVSLSYPDSVLNERTLIPFPELLTPVNSQFSLSP